MKYQLYFAYGSNLNKVQMAKRCPESIPFQKAYLNNARILFRGTGTGVLDIERSDNYTVEGALYLVSSNDIEALDKYEGYPYLYNRVSVTVELEDEIAIKAFAYKKVSKKTIATPTDMYYHICLQGFKDWGLDINLLKEAAMITYRPHKYKNII